MVSECMSLSLSRPMYCWSIALGRGQAYAQRSPVTDVGAQVALQHCSILRTGKSECSRIASAYQTHVNKQAPCCDSRMEPLDAGGFDPDGVRQRRQSRRAVDEPLWMGCIRLLQDYLPLRQTLMTTTIVNIGRREQGQPGMMMLLVVPGEEVLAPLASIGQGTKAVWIARSVLQSAELSLRKRVVIRYMGAAVTLVTPGHSSTGPSTWRSWHHPGPHGWSVVLVRPAVWHRRQQSNPGPRHKYPVGQQPTHHVAAVDIEHGI